MFAYYFLLLAALAHLSVQISDQHRFDNLIQFKSNSTTCAMFSKSCKIEIILNKNLNLNALQVNPYKTKFYKFLKLQLCQSNNGDVDNCHVKFYDDLNAHEIELNIAYIYIDAIIVGKSQLFLNYSSTSDNHFVINGKVENFDSNEQNIGSYILGDNQTALELTTSYYLKHDIIISSPQRLLDTIHMVYVIIFQTIVSIFMGLLLELKSLIKIIKMPIPVLVGFVSQYVFMPLVSLLK